jgi:hypothetical protein
VQEQRLAAEPLLQMCLEHVAELGELREDERPVPLGERLVEDLLEARQLSRAGREL